MIPDRYGLENFMNALDNPSKFLIEGRRLFNHSLLKYKYGRRKAIDIMEQDWDNLIILDACRYDIFKEENHIEGELNKVLSKGSHSEEFIDHNFHGQHHDTVYVSSNSWASKLRNKNVFYKVAYTYSRDYDNKTRHEKHQSFDPSRVLEIGNANYNESKRFILHFMQPHAPYWGPKAKSVRSDLRKEYDIGFKAWDPNEEVSDEDPTHLLRAARMGYVSNEVIKEVYKENTHIVLDKVDKLLKNIQGKTIITADHGELLGESQIICYKDFGHPRNIYLPELRHVPWLTIESNERREIYSEKPIKSDFINENDIETNLRALGYLD